MIAFWLGSVAGSLATLAFLAWWLGATRKTPEERAADDHDQMLALSGRASGDAGTA